MRARQRYLGLLPNERPILDEDLVPLERVTLVSAARHSLRRQLYVPGRLRGGLLFGRCRDGTMEVMLATPMGYPWWYSNPSDALLAHDERYVLGWSDCIETIHGGTVDWVGNWLAYPDSTLGAVCQDLTWLHLGVEHGLIDDRHILLMIGWNDGALAARAHSYDFGEWNQLACDFLPSTGSRSSDAFS
jgi:hypothetical protein